MYIYMYIHIVLSAMMVLLQPGYSRHRRRIKTEEKAQVVAAVWGKELIKFLASYFAAGCFDERDEFILFFLLSRCNSSYSSYRPGTIHPILQIVLVQNSKHGKEMSRFCPPPSSNDDLCLLLCLYPSVWVLNLNISYPASRLICMLLQNVLYFLRHPVPFFK